MEKKERKKVIQGQFAVLLNISGATRCSIRILVVLDHFRCY